MVYLFYFSIRCLGQTTIRYDFVDFLYCNRSIFIIKINLILLGILHGNMYDLGDFDECFNIDEPDDFDPQYWYANQPQ